MTNLRWIGCHHLSFFNEEFSVSWFYEIIMAHIPCLSKEYVIHVKSTKFKGSPLDEWIIFNASSSSALIEVTELYSYILHSINKCKKFNKDVAVASSVISEDDTDDNLDKEIYLIFYRSKKK